MKKTNIILLSILAMLIIVATSTIIIIKKTLKAANIGDVPYITTTELPEGAKYENTYRLKLLDLEEVVVKGALDIDYIPDNEIKLVVFTDSVRHSLFKLKAIGKTATMEINEKVRTRIKCTLYAPPFNNLTTTSGGYFHSDDSLVIEKFKINSSSGSITELKGSFDNIHATISSGAKLNLQGTGDKIILKANSGSKAQLKNFQSSHCFVTAFSGSTAYIQSDVIEATASSGAIIYYNEDTHLKMSHSELGGQIKQY